MLFINSIGAMAKMPYMEKVNINWDLRPDGIAIPFETYVSGYGYMRAKVEFTECEWNVNKNGSVDVSFTAKFIDNKTPKLSDSKIHEIANSGRNMKRYYSICMVDYMTGKCLDYGFDTDMSDSYYVYDEHGCKVQVANGIAYGHFKTPKGYANKKKHDNVVIVAGGSTEKLLDNNNYDNKFFKGKKKFGDTSKVDKDNAQISHAMKLGIK